MKKTLQGFSKAYLHSLFSYNSRTGLITRRVARSNSVKVGDIVGSLDGKGYLHVSVDKKFIRLHRLAYFLFYGIAPTLVDHVNRKRTDNRIVNLRMTSNKTNVGNSGLSCRNTSGVKGVSFNTRRQKWHAQIKIDGKQTYLGSSTSKVVAAKLYKAAAKKHFAHVDTRA